MALKILDEHRAEALEALCEQILPGSSRIGPAVYIDAVLATMPGEVQSAAIGAIDALGADPSAEALSRQQRTPDFALLRALAIEAYYSDFVAPGKEGPGSWAEIDFEPPLATDLDRDWSYLGIEE